MPAGGRAHWTEGRRSRGDYDGISMGLEIRPARRDELEDYLRVVHYLFAAPPASEYEDHRRRWDFDPSRTICAFVDGQLVSTYGSFPLRVRLNVPRYR